MEDTSFLYELAINPADGAMLSSFIHVGFVAAVTVAAWEFFDMKNTILRPAIETVSGGDQAKLPASRGGM